MIGEFDGDTAILNSLLPSLRFAYAELGASANSSGTLNLLAGSINSSDFYVGTFGTGVVNVANGTVVSSPADLGSKSGGTGTI